MSVGGCVYEGWSGGGARWAAPGGQPAAQLCFGKAALLVLSVWVWN